MTDIDPKSQHQFWNTQPVVQLNEKPAEIGAITIVEDIEQIPKEPYPLVPGFQWCVVNTQNEEEKLELYEFLRKHYVVHPQNTFRFAYSPEFLDWALHPPGWRPEWLLGVRVESTNKIVGFISAIPITVRAYEKTMQIVAVDFLSVHQGLRGKNMAPILIKEVTRRVNLTGIFQAIYTAGKLITQPFTTAQYFHRLINYEKLVAIKFTTPRVGTDIKKEARLHQLPKTLVSIPGFRAMKEEDVPQVTVNLNQKLESYKIAQHFTEEEVRHNFLPRKGIVGSYVIEKRNVIEGFFSFYIVPSTVIDCPEYDNYTAAYIYYYYCKPSIFTDLAKAAMFMAHSEFGADVINCLNILDNTELLNTLKFVPGDGKLNYYLFNYAVETFKPEKCGVVLL